MKLKKACEAYKDYFAENNIRDTECTLIYLDDDNIPECIYKSEAQSIVLKYVNGEVIPAYGDYGTTWFAYRERTGEFMFAEMGGSHMASTFYKCTDSGFEKLGSIDKWDVMANGSRYEYYLDGVEEDVGEQKYLEYEKSFGEYADVSLDYNSIEEAYEALVN